ARAISSLPATSSARAMRRRRREKSAAHLRHPGLDPGPACSCGAGRRRVPGQARDDGETVTAPFPTRKQEEWRYADLDALQPVWQQFAEPLTLTVGPGERFEKVWLPGDEAVQVRRVQIALEAGAKARVFVLNTASEYGRVELDVSLAEGA